MRTSLLFAALAFGWCASGLLASPAYAQRGTSVTLIDINHIFKTHSQFVQAREELKGEMSKFEDYARQVQQDLVKKRDQLKDFNPGSVEYKNLEKEVAQVMSDLQVQAQLKRKELVEREAKLYFNHYKAIEYEIAAFAQANQIDLVLRFSREEMDPNKPDKVLQGVNRAVVYQQKLDITDLILENLARRAPPAANVGQRPTGPVVPQRQPLR